MDKAVIRVHLEEMPFARHNEEGWHNPTGDYVKLDDNEGLWRVEYEDCIYEDAPGCQHFEGREYFPENFR